MTDMATARNVDAEYRRHRLAIIIAITLGYGMSYTCRLAINVAKKPLIDAGIFTPEQLGVIGSALFFTYAAGKLLNGFLADYVNPRIFMAIGLVLSALCNIGMGFTTTLFLATLLWGINGWFQSFGAPACVISIANWYSNKERGRFYGIWSTSHSIGEGLNFIVTGSIVAAFGWRWGFWGAAIGVLFTAVGCYWAMADRPTKLGLPPVAQWKGEAPPADPEANVDVEVEARKGGLFLTQLSILKIPSVWTVAVASALAYVTRYAINSWGILYLQEARGYPLAAAGSLLAINTLAGVAGAVAFGYVSDKWFDARRPPANLIFGLIEIAGLLLLFYGPANTSCVVIAMILFGLGMTGLVTSVGGLFAIDICPKRVAGAALGMVGVFSYLGAGIQDQVSGKLISGGMHVVNGVKQYDFTAAIWFWVGASIVSLVLASTLWKAKLRD